MTYTTETQQKALPFLRHEFVAQVLTERANFSAASIETILQHALESAANKFQQKFHEAGIDIPGLMRETYQSNKASIDWLINKPVASLKIEGQRLAAQLAL